MTASLTNATATLRRPAGGGSGAGSGAVEKTGAPSSQALTVACQTLRARCGPVDPESHSLAFTHPWRAFLAILIGGEGQDGGRPAKRAFRPQVSSRHSRESRHLNRVLIPCAAGRRQLRPAASPPLRLQPGTAPGRSPAAPDSANPRPSAGSTLETGKEPQRQARAEPQGRRWAMFFELAFAR